ncbi:MAG: hypothetical protein ACR2NR_22125 [Solirubrobacteraceae bacterium]
MLIAALTSVALLGAVEHVSTSAAAKDQAPSQRVIIVLKNQVRKLPATRRLAQARRSAVRSIQAPLTRQLAAAGSTNVRSYSLLNAGSATVTPAERTTLRSNPAVSEVVADQLIHLAPATPTTGTGASAAAASGSPAASGVCSAPGKTQLNPEALGSVHADSDTPGAQTPRSLGFDGSGVTVAFIADGLDINNLDFIRANGQHVFVDYKDFSGEGTGVPTGGEEAFGDASSIAAQGRQVYDVSNFGPHAVTTPCDIRVEGVAPGARLVGLDIFGAEDKGFNSSFLDAINYAVTADHVNVLNESLR